MEEWETSTRQSEMQSATREFGKCKNRLRRQFESLTRAMSHLPVTCLKMRKFLRERTSTMPNGSGVYRLVGACSLLLAVVALHIYTLLEEEATARKLRERDAHPDKREPITAKYPE